MQYTRLGESGLVVSRLCLGTMTFGSDPSVPSIYKVDGKAAAPLISRALEAGVNFFDTADGYSAGQSEEILGAALDRRRLEAVIATKVGFRTGSAVVEAGLSRRHILSACDASLRRLRTDYIDLYLAHKEDPFTPLEETLSAFDAVVRAGKVRYLGFSNWSAWRAATALQMQRSNGWARFVSGQYYYSLVGRDVEHELVPLLRFAGVAMMVWSPLAGGFLSGKYTRTSLAEKGNRLSGFDFLPFDKEEGFRVVEKVRALAERREASVAQVAIAWLLARPAVSAVVIGASVSAVVIGASKASQLEDNLAAAGLILSPEEVDELERATARPAPYPQWYIASLVDPRLAEILPQRA